MDELILIKYLKEKDVLNTKSSKVDINTDCETSNLSTTEFFTPIQEVNYDENIEQTKYDSHITSSVTDREFHAKNIVNDMWHQDNYGRKNVGEKYSIDKAKEVCERYKSLIPTNVNYIDVYMAINSQYHDYNCLYKTWFGENNDNQIIESAIMYWFRDSDYDKDSKIRNCYL